MVGAGEDGEKGNGPGEGRDGRLYISGRGPQGPLVLPPRAPRPPLREPAAPPCPVPSPAGGPEIRGRRPGRSLLGGVKMEGHWMATAVVGRRPLVRFGASLSPLAVLLPSPMVAYRAVCPTGDARQGDLAGSGDGSFLQGNRHAWPLKRLADVDQRWRQVAQRGHIN